MSEWKILSDDVRPKVTECGLPWIMRTPAAEAEQAARLLLHEDRRNPWRMPADSNETASIIALRHFLRDLHMLCTTAENPGSCYLSPLESAEELANALGEASTRADAEHIAYFLTLFHAGKLRGNFCFDELHAFLASVPSPVTAGSFRQEPAFIALQSFAAFGSRTLTIAYATALLKQAWSAPNRTRNTVDVCLNGLMFAPPFDGQGELLRTHAEEAVQAHPDNHTFHYRLAAGLHLCGRHDEALDSIDTALALLAASPTASLNVLQNQYLTKRDAIQEGRLRARRHEEQQRRWDQQAEANAQLERSLHTSSVRAVEVVAVFTAAIAFAVDRLWLLAAQGAGLAIFALLTVGGTWLITRSHHQVDRGSE